MTQPETTPLRIYVSMVGDLFHPDHAKLLEQARALGDELIVGIHSDSDAAKLGGKPVMNMIERASVVKACRHVDAVIPNAPLSVTPEFLDGLGVKYACLSNDYTDEQGERMYGQIRALGRLKQLASVRVKKPAGEFMRRAVARGEFGFVSDPIAIDFVADHDLQAVAGMSAFKALSRHFDCRWRIGTAQKCEGAKAAVMLDHLYTQLDVCKTPHGYKHLFYLSHDLGDTEVYGVEKKWLAPYDIVFVPGPAHYEPARAALGDNQMILEVGWPKYDDMQAPEECGALMANILREPRPFTILFAPTYAHTWEWKELLPHLRNLEARVIVKNHIYLNPGQPLPPGHEKEYADALKSAQEMEDELGSYGRPDFIVAPRNMNVCSLFPFVDFVITDQSSVALEFSPFGLSIETGRYFLAGKMGTAPNSSLLSKNVHFIPTARLADLLSRPGAFVEFVSAQRLAVDAKPAVARLRIASGELIAHLIDMYLFLKQRNPEGILARLWGPSQPDVSSVLNQLCQNSRR